MNVWILFTLAAALMQTTRFVLQKRLKGAGLSSTGATFARFLFAAPVAAAIAAVTLTATGAGLPVPGGPFWLYVLAGGVAQIVATDLTVALFGMRNFAVGVAFTKTETVQVALFSALILGEAVNLGGWAAILVGLAGVLILSKAPAGAGRPGARPVVYGVLAGALFGVASIGYRGATLALEPAPYFLRATVALSAATLSQTVLMAFWLAWRDPGQMRLVLSRWRQTALVGLTGMLGSLGWFTAFSLQNAAYVRALGQVEIVFTLMASVFLFRERIRWREAGGIALVVGSLLVLILTAR